MKKGLDRDVVEPWKVTLMVITYLPPQVFVVSRVV